MPLPPSRQELIAGIVDDVRRSGRARPAGVASRRGGRSFNTCPPAGVDAPGLARAPGNPFASFYQRRRRVSAASASEAADPSSSITQAYIVPESLLALARGDGEPEVDPARDTGISSRRSLATNSGDASTESQIMFRRERALNIDRVVRWRALLRTASRVAEWLRGRARHSIAD